MKKLWVMGSAIILILSMINVAAADSYFFIDTIENWGEDDYWGRVEIPNWPETFKYQHDINDEVDFAAGDLVTHAYLALDFDWDRWDGHGTYTNRCGYTVEWDFREYSYIQWDEEEWKYIGEVDNNYEFLTVGIDWLNVDGQLDVSLYVRNPLETANAWLDRSILFGCAETGSGSPTPVPEPGTMLLLGTGMVGMILPGYKKIFKKKNKDQC